jgi:hypothetical protein
MGVFPSLQFFLGDADLLMPLGSIVPPTPESQSEQMMFINIFGALGFLILCTLCKPEMNGSKMIALCLAIADALMLLEREGKDVPFVFLLIPVTFIWFADALGGFKGNVGRGGIINTETPGWMVAGFGWLLLLPASAFVVYHYWRLPPQHG